MSVAMKYLYKNIILFCKAVCLVGNYYDNDREVSFLHVL